MKKIVCIVCLLLFCNFVYADVDIKFINDAETYLNSITGLKGGFTQIANGKTETGIFSMLRPGKIRLDYKNTPIQLISDGDDLYFYDKSLDQITTVPLTSTPAGILVRKHIDLQHADIVVSETQNMKDDFSLKLYLKNQEELGYMLVNFSKKPIKLTSWHVIDATGNDTYVKFDGLKTKTTFDQNYFQISRHKTISTSDGDAFYE